MQQLTAAIAPLEAGFKRFAVRPQTGDLNRISCRVPTQHGTIEMRWQREKNSATFEITVPLYCVAQVELDALFENQSGNWSFEDQNNAAELGAGTYQAT